MDAETPSPPEQKQKRHSADRSKSGVRRWTAMVLLICVGAACAARAKVFDNPRRPSLFI
jgi:hypothetical protein